ncbi:hypothetical protein B0H10DRAFT_2209561 [Mycena sp. CBHHK59/15]|nr:hypothetical protein B0H10DRAFT_2209561 [Mycena sp. CBHHK59/15]
MRLPPPSVFPFAQGTSAERLSRSPTRSPLALPRARSCISVTGPSARRSDSKQPLSQHAVPFWLAAKTNVTRPSAIFRAAGAIPAIAMPAPDALLAPAFFTLCSAYTLLARHFTTPRQRAWILTTIASAVMTAASVPFMCDYLAAGGDVARVKMRPALADSFNRFFQAYLVADLAVGGLCYPSQIGLLTGWVHHVVYIGVTEVAIRSSWAHIFCLCASMELPTLLLGVGTLIPRLRYNTLFAASFLATRIILHLVLLAAYAHPAARPGGSLVPAGILASVFPLHAMWFAGCVRGFVRRAAKAGVVAVETAPRHPLAPDVFPDARSLARHAYSPAASPSRSCDPAALSARLRRRLAFVTEARMRVFGEGRAHLLDAVSDQAVRRRLRGVRPGMAARRVSASLIAALPSRERVFDYVGLGK